MNRRGFMGAGVAAVAIPLPTLAAKDRVQHHIDAIAAIMSEGAPSDSTAVVVHIKRDAAGTRAWADAQVNEASRYHRMPCGGWTA